MKCFLHAIVNEEAAMELNCKMHREADVWILQRVKIFMSDFASQELFSRYISYSLTQTSVRCEIYRASL